MPACQPDTRYLASPEFVATAFHVITAIAIPVFIFGVYCILFKTPAPMKPVQYYLMNVHIWSIVSDLTISLFGVPYIFYLAKSGYALGIVDYPGTFFYCGSTLFIGLTVAVISIFENRYFGLFGHDTWWKHARKPFLVFSYLLAPLVFAPVYAVLPDQDSATRYVMQTFPCLPLLPPSASRTFFVLAIDLTLIAACTLCAWTYYAVSMITFGVLTVKKLQAKTNETRFSQKTLAIQKTLMFAILIQSAVVMINVFIPVFTFVFMNFTRIDDQIVNNFINMCFSIHGLSSAIGMIFAHTPYREFTFSLIFCWRKTEESSANTLYTTQVACGQIR